MVNRSARSWPAPGRCRSRASSTSPIGSLALTAAHLQGVVHRDMHPQNVFVMPGTGGQSERIKVLDFGISKIASISQKITGMAAVMGTPQYMSPEQAEGRATSSTRRRINSRWRRSSTRC